jgi:hypothetical protein
MEELCDELCFIVTKKVSMLLTYLPCNQEASDPNLNFHNGQGDQTSRF